MSEQQDAEARKRELLRLRRLKKLQERGNAFLKNPETWTKEPETNESNTENADKSLNNNIIIAETKENEAKNSETLNTNAEAKGENQQTNNADLKSNINQTEEPITPPRTSLPKMNTNEEEDVTPTTPGSPPVAPSPVPGKVLFLAENVASPTIQLPASAKIVRLEPLSPLPATDNTDTEFTKPEPQEQPAIRRPKPRTPSQPLFSRIEVVPLLLFLIATLLVFIDKFPQNVQRVVTETLPSPVTLLVTISVAYILGTLVLGSKRQTGATSSKEAPSSGNFSIMDILLLLGSGIAIIKSVRRMTRNIAIFVVSFVVVATLRDVTQTIQ